MHCSLLTREKKESLLPKLRSFGIPIVAIVDTNCDPDEIDYVIPATTMLSALLSSSQVLWLTLSSKAARAGRAAEETEEAVAETEE